MQLLTPRPSDKQLSLWMRQLATMLHAGVPITNALATLKNQKSQRALQEATATALHAILEGGSLAHGLGRTPTVFSPFMISLILAGERAGILGESLESICRTIDERRSLKSRLVRAAMYPCIVLLTLGVVTAFLLTWVIPTFEDLFSESDITLPWLTQVVLAASRSAANYWHLGVLSVVVLLTGCSYLLKRSISARRVIEQLSLSTPLYKELTRTRYAHECASLLASLLRAGIPIIEAIEILIQTVRNSVVSNDLLRTRTELHEGRSLSASLERSTIFPPLVAQMVGIGELSGHVDEMLAKTGSLCREEADEAIETIKQVAEPALILLIGIVVGTLVLAIYLPIFQIGDVSGIR